MTLLNPYWLIFLVVIPLIVGCVFLARAFNHKDWSKLVAKRLRDRLSIGTKQERHWIGFSLQLLALACIIIAAARPSLGETKVEVQTKGHHVFILLDNSLSMLAEDVSPSRIDLAHAQAISIMDALPNARFGLASFSSNLQLLSPYSADHKAVKRILKDAKPHYDNAGGSNMSDALVSILSLLDEKQSPAHAIIVISDGEEHSEFNKQAIINAKKQGTAIFTIGVGTKTGSTIPAKDDHNLKYRDRDGAVVHTKLAETSLRQLARATGGTYTNASKQGLSRLQFAIEAMKKTESDSRSYTQPKESFTWFLVSAIILIVLGSLTKISLRSPAINLLMLGLMVSFGATQNLQAEITDSNNASLIEKFVDRPAKLRSGRSALSDKKYKSAISDLKAAAKTANGDQLAEIHFSLGEAYSKLKNYGKAQIHFSRALLHQSADTYANASYNLANSLFNSTWEQLKPPSDRDFKTHLTEQLVKLKLGKKDSSFEQATLDQAKTQWTEAVQYYDTAFQDLPSLTKANTNKKTVQSLLDIIKQAEAESDKRVEEIKEKEKEKKDEQKSPKNQTGKEDEKPQDSKSGKENKEDGSKKSGKDGKPEDSKNPTKKDPNSPNKKDTPNGNKEQDPAGKPEHTGKSKPSQAKLDEKEAERLLQEQDDQVSSPFKANLKRNPRTSKDW